VATQLALRGWKIDASPVQHKNIVEHIAAVKRAGGYLELQAAIAFWAWRLGQESPTIATGVGLTPTNVRQALCRMKRIAFTLGFDTGAANHRRGATYPFDYCRHKKAEAKSPGLPELTQTL
jgi:hypothetical protein